MYSLVCTVALQSHDFKCYKNRNSTFAGLKKMVLFTTIVFPSFLFKFKLNQKTLSRTINISNIFITITWWCIDRALELRLCCNKRVCLHHTRNVFYYLFISPPIIIFNTLSVETKKKQQYPFIVSILHL